MTADYNKISTVCLFHKLSKQPISRVQYFLDIINDPFCHFSLGLQILSTDPWVFEKFLGSPGLYCNQACSLLAISEIACCGLVIFGKQRVLMGVNIRPAFLVMFLRGIQPTSSFLWDQFIIHGTSEGLLSGIWQAGKSTEFNEKMVEFPAMLDYHVRYDS